jgi:hypothetical protein
MVRALTSIAAPTSAEIPKLLSSLVKSIDQAPSTSLICATTRTSDSERKQIVF